MAHTPPKPWFKFGPNPVRIRSKFGPNSELGIRSGLLLASIAPWRLARTFRVYGASHLPHELPTPPNASQLIIVAPDADALLRFA